MINYLYPARSAFLQLANPFPEAFVSRFLVHLEHIYILEKACLVEPLLRHQVHVLKKSRLALAHFASDRTKHSQGGTLPQQDLTSAGLDVILLVRIFNRSAS